MSGTVYVSQRPDGTFGASLVELPGCFAFGATREEAVTNLGGAFHDYLSLLAERRVSTDHWRTLDPATFVVRDAQAPGAIPEDFQPLAEHEIRDFLHQLEAARGATLALVRDQAAERLERRPDEETWSLREILEHLATVQVQYLAKLEKWPDRDFATLQAVHRMIIQRFAVMEPADTALDHEVRGRRWSVRKVMRRLLEHEYEHLRQMKEVVARLP